MDIQATLESALAERYAFKREIGRGGMAAVYLAEDIKHGRRVAVKVLHPDLGAIIGPERFLAEIRITANLQHPNLLPLFDSGEVDGLLYYVMPFVDGESLRARLSREKQLPIDEALHIATTVASALDHAHRHGVIHRDLKPENILLQEGEPLIADFGIALAVSHAAGSRLTQTGLSLGTPQYMSPEQATGERSIDARADIYALGAVLYEMLTGEPPHTGPTAQAVIAKVLGEPARSVRVMRDAVPPHVDAAILRALAKIPADRWSTAQAFATALTTASSTSAAVGVYPAPQPNRSSFAARLRQSTPFAAVALVIGALGVAVALRPWRRAPEASYAFVVTLPDSATVSTGGGGSGEIAISRDGRTIAYVAGTVGGGDVKHGIWARALDELVAKPVRGIDRAEGPRFSPDGQTLAYVDRSGLYVARLSGNQPTRLAKGVSSLDWINGESIIYSVGREQWASRRFGPEVWITTVHNPAPRRLIARDTTRQIFGVGLPAALPGGEYALVTIWKEELNPRREIAVASLKDGSITELGLAGTNARYSLGHLLFVKDDGGLYAVPFSLGARRVTGAPVQIVPQIVVKVTGLADYDVADNGTLVYVGGSEARRRLVLVDRTGKSSALLPDIRRFYFPRVSPDGRVIAVEVGTSQGFDLWSYNLESKTLGAMTTDRLSIRPGGWLDHGATIAYIQVQLDSTIARFKPRTRAADGRGASNVFVDSSLGATDVTTGGNFIAFLSNGIQVMPVGAPTQRRVLVPPSADPGNMRLSADGRYLAYESTASGTTEIYARSVLDQEAQLQISSGGGTEPIWSPRGDEIFYRSASHLISAHVSLSPLRLLRRDTLFRDGFLRAAVSTNYDIMPNGQQFVMVANESPDVYPTVIVNWLRRIRGQ